MNENPSTEDTQTSPTSTDHQGARRRPGTAVDPAIAQLWDSYKQTGDLRHRNQLLTAYAPLVQRVARRISSGLPANIDFGDLVSYGVFGLIDAVEKFDPQRGTLFEPYAAKRIWGAIMDGLRSLDLLPRSTRAKVRGVERAFGELEKELGRTPTWAEVADRLDITVRDLHQLLTAASLASTLALDELVYPDSSRHATPIALGDLLADSRIEQPGDALIEQEDQQALRDAIAKLPQRYRIVISLYYYEGLTLAEIGQVLQVTESRACQLHTKATRALRDALTKTEAL